MVGTLRSEHLRQDHAGCAAIVRHLECRYSLKAQGQRLEGGSAALAVGLAGRIQQMLTAV